MSCLFRQTFHCDELDMIINNDNTMPLTLPIDILRKMVLLFDSSTYTSRVSICLITDILPEWYHVVKSRYNHKNDNTPIFGLCTYPLKKK